MIHLQNSEILFNIKMKLYVLEVKLQTAEGNYAYCEKTL